MKLPDARGLVDFERRHGHVILVLRNAEDHLVEEDEGVFDVGQPIVDEHADADGLTELWYGAL